MSLLLEINASAIEMEYYGIMAPRPNKRIQAHLGVGSGKGKKDHIIIPNLLQNKIQVNIENYSVRFMISSIHRE